MSKIGEKQIDLPEGVKVEIKDHSVHISGKEGELTFQLPATIEVEFSGKKLIVKRKKEDKKTKSLHGLYRSLIANAIAGIEKPWYKNLEVVGTGFAVKLKGEDLEFKLGYSHPILFKSIPGIKFQVEGNNKVSIMGSDKQLVGQVAHQIKSIRMPDIYKGKGIKYEGEKVRIKPGKKAKTAQATVTQ